VAADLDSADGVHDIEQVGQHGGEGARVEIVERRAGQPLRHGVRPPGGLAAGCDRRYRQHAAHDRADGLVLREVPAVLANPQHHGPPSDQG